MSDPADIGINTATPEGEFASEFLGESPITKNGRARAGDVERAAEAFLAKNEGIDRKELSKQYNDPDIVHTLPGIVTERGFFQMLAILRLGGSQGDAADLGGISSAAFTRYYEKGRELHESGWDVERNPLHENTGFVNFYRGCKKAVTEGKMRLVQRIWSAASRGNWKAGAWILERKWPGEFGKRMHLTVEETTGDLVKDAMSMPPSERRKQLAELEAIQNAIDMPSHETVAEDDPGA